MARFTKNALLLGLKGLLGKDLVFREVNGKTIGSFKGKPSNKKATVAQDNTRKKFKEASKSAKKETRDTLKKEHYEKIAKNLNLPNPYTAAIKEFMAKKSV